jgi:hypothetical protein
LKGAGPLSSLTWRSTGKDCHSVRKGAAEEAKPLFLLLSIIEGGGDKFSKFPLVGKRTKQKKLKRIS